jgi:putative peptidoglycan lipid II flippase
VTARVRAWFGRSTNRQILGASATIAVLTLVARAASLARDVAVAYGFGRGDELDAFLIALLLPTFAINVVANSLNAAFVPVFIEVRERDGAARADLLFQSVLAVSVLVLVAVSVLVGLAFPASIPHLARTFDDAKLALTARLFWWLLPIVLLSGLTTLWTGVLNAGERFALGAIAPMAVPAVSAAAIVFAGAHWGIDALAAGTVAGYLAAAAIVAVAVARSGWSTMPRWHGMTPELRRVLGQCVPVFAGACLMSSTALTDQTMASALAAGSVSALSYGNKGVALLTSLLTMSLGTAVLPHFSKMVARGDWAGVRHTLRTWVRVIVLVTVPVTVAMIAASSWFVRIAFEHGAFTSRDTEVVAYVQSMYLVQIPFYTVGILFVRMLTSMQRNRALLWGTAISVPLNFGLNYLFMWWMDAAGIALSTSVMYVVSCGYLGLMLRRAIASRAPLATGAELDPAAALSYR